MRMRRMLRLAPQRGALSGTPAHPSYSHAGTPADATCYERCRDAILNLFVRHACFFIFLAVLAIVLIIAFGLVVAYVFVDLHFGWVIDLGVLNVHMDRLAYAPEMERCSNMTLAVQAYLDAFPDAAAAPDAYATASQLYMPATRTMPPSIDGWYVAGHCTTQQWWFNFCIKMFTFIFVRRLA